MSKTGGSEEIDDNTALLGRRLRELRQRRRLSLRALATEAGVSASYVSLIENGQANVSVQLLRRLANVFGIEWLDLFQNPPQEGRVLRREDRPRLSPGGGQVHHSITRPPLLDLEVGAVEYSQGSSSGEFPYAHGDVHEVFIVLKGRFHFELQDEVFEMRHGDSIDFRSSVPHKVTALDDVNEGLWISTPPAGLPGRLAR